MFQATGKRMSIDLKLETIHAKSKESSKVEMSNRKLLKDQHAQGLLIRLVLV